MLKNEIKFKIRSFSFFKISKKYFPRVKKAPAENNSSSPNISKIPQEYNYNSDLKNNIQQQNNKLQNKSKPSQHKKKKDYSSQSDEEMPDGFYKKEEIKVDDLYEEYGNVS